MLYTYYLCTLTFDIVDDEKLSKVYVRAKNIANSEEKTLCCKILKLLLCNH